MVHLVSGGFSILLFDIVSYNNVYY
jgi:hypothetical protein